MLTERRTERGSSVSLMTAFTKGELERELADAESRVQKSRLDIGEAAGSESDWHDNPGFDYANMSHDLHSSKYLSLQAKLANVEIITPRSEVGDVGIGNDVLVKFQGEDQSERFTLLGPDDANRKSGWISYLSPLGQKILGKKKGDKANYQVGHSSQSVEILGIFPGSFNP